MNPNSSEKNRGIRVTQILLTFLLLEFVKLGFNFTACVRAGRLLR